MIRAIAAIDSKLGIAKHEKLPWSLPTDKNYYHGKIADQTLVMGYRTYKKYPEPITDKPNYVWIRPGTELNAGFVPLLDEQIDPLLSDTKEDIWVIGGGALFTRTLSLTDELYLTRIQGDFDCDVFFPPFEDKFTLKSRSHEYHENGLSFCFEVWQKISLQK